MSPELTTSLLRLCAHSQTITVGILLGKGRENAEVIARKLACYVMHEHFGFCGRQMAKAIGRNPSCCNMTLDWVADVRVRKALLDQARSIYAKLTRNAAAVPPAPSLTTGPVFTLTTPDTPRLVLACDNETHYIACYEDGQWCDAQTEDPIDAVIQSWQELNIA